MDMLDTKKLNELMVANRWNSSSLAVAAGLPQATVWRTSRGATTPSLETLAKICAVLKIRIADLIVEPFEEKEAA
ncbi:MAG: helix-turn-helix transcriptional regulator [Pyrinomonadaceae bacterium]